MFGFACSLNCSSFHANSSIALRNIKVSGGTLIKNDAQTVYNEVQLIILIGNRSIRTWDKTDTIIKKLHRKGKWKIKDIVVAWNKSWWTRK